MSITVRVRTYFNDLRLLKQIRPLSVENRQSKMDVIIRFFAVKSIIEEMNTTFD